MSEEPIIIFKAAMPAIQTALRISGDGNGARLLLDIPEIEMEAVAALLAMRREELIVTVQRATQVEESLSGSSKAHNRTAFRPTGLARRRVQRPTD